MKVNGNFQRGLQADTLESGEGGGAGYLASQDLRNPNRTKSFGFYSVFLRRSAYLPSAALDARELAQSPPAPLLTLSERDRSRRLDRG